MGSKIKSASLVMLFVLLLLAVLSMRPFARPASTQMDDYFIENGQAETGSNNIVTSVVFDYRGMDTLGEVSILFAAVTGVFLAFRRREKNDK